MSGLFRSPSPRFPRTRVRSRVDALEDRSTPATLVGLTTANGLVTFDSADPGTIQKSVTVSGLQAGESLVGIDFRSAADPRLYGPSSGNRVYVIDPATGAATAVGTDPFTPALAGTDFGFDFNPAADKIRVVSGTGQNLRLNADTPATATVDPNLAFDPARFAAVFGQPSVPAPQVVATAYTKNVNPATGKTATTQYVIDANLDVLATQGGPGGTPSPNTGTLFVVDKLGFDAGPQTAFDIEGGTDNGFAVSGNKLYAIDIATGKGTLVGTVGGAVGLQGLAVAAPAAGAGTVALSAAAAAFDEDRSPLAVTVTRTGGSTGTATVDFATAAGTATAGVDFLPANGTVTFNPGQTSQTVFLSLPAGPVPLSAAETFTLTLSNPTGGATLGGTTTATITIPAVTAVPPTGRFFAAGSGAGGSPTVNVYDEVTGQQAFSFAALESSFTGGVTVATGDVNGDGVEDVIVGTGVGGSPRVRVIDGASLSSTSQTTLADFFAYEDTFRGGVNVAAGDINGDGFDDVLIGSGVGGGPRVRVVSGDGLTSAAQTLLADFFAYEDSFRGGVNVAAGEFTGDGKADIAAGSGFGGGPRIRVFDGAVVTTPGGDTTTSLADFFAYESTFRNGVNAAAGDINGDGFTDIVAGAGPGGGPNVQVFSGQTQAFAPLGGFFAFDQASRGGVRVSTADLNADGTDEVLTGSGAGAAAQLRAFGFGGTQVGNFSSFDGFTGGVFVG